MRWLAARDRSEQEVRARLAAFGASAGVIAATIGRLRELHYLDERRFARGVAEAAVRRGQGSARVRAALTAKGVPDGLIDEAVVACFADEIALARQALERRHPAPPRSVAERAKAARFLLQRGFPEAAVLAILGEGC